MPGECPWEENKNFRSWAYRHVFEIIVDVHLLVVVRNNTLLRFP